jgi:uncharacterized protein
MEENSLVQLSFEEIRVLGALMEKSRTTPDYYPMTLNGIVTACNQKSARNPVVEFDDETVVLALDSLKKKHLSGNVIGGGSRALKYRHNLAMTFPLDPAEVSVLCLLFLRGPLTPGEIKSNGGRLYDFDDLAEVQRVLEALASYETPFVTQLPKMPGQKEARYAHLFCDLPEISENMFTNEPARKNISQLEERLETVENELAELKEKVDKLMSELYS